MRYIRIYLARMMVVLTVLAMGSVAHAAAGSSALDDGISAAVKTTTGVNPNDYPCAKEGIVTLFQQRQQIAGLSSFHPQRIFTWLLDTTVYYTHKVINFFRGLFNPSAIENGIRQIQAMATSGDPLGRATGAVDRAVANVDGWTSALGSRSQSVLTGKVHGIIENTTNSDGSCKG